MNDCLWNVCIFTSKPCLDPVFETLSSFHFSVNSSYENHKSRNALKFEMSVFCEMVKYAWCFELTFYERSWNFERWFVRWWCRLAVINSKLLTHLDPFLLIGSGFLFSAGVTYGNDEAFYIKTLTFLEMHFVVTPSLRRFKVLCKFDITS